MTPLKIIAACVAACVFSACPAAADTYAVGVAAVDITPGYAVRLSGFGFRRAESEGVTQPIYVRALAIGEDDPAVLITVDNLGIPDAMVEELAKRLKKAGVRRERLAVTATHTHTAPMLTGVCPTLFGVAIPPEHQKHLDRYTRELADNLEKAALAALKDRAPARLFWGVGKVGFAANRRTRGGPVDHDLPLLIVKDLKGNVRAVYVSYACHCVTLSNNKVSGDWAGYAADAIQRQHPGAVALVSVGCGADQNPNSGVTGDKADIAAAQGAEIAREVDRLLKGFLAPVTGKLTAKLARFDLEFDTLPTRAQWEERAKRDDAVGYHAKVQLAKLDRGEALPTKLPYSVQTWAFGDRLAMVFLPGEVVVDYSLRLKKELDSGRVWVNAYSNDAPCYIPSERVLKEGGYEGEGAMVYYDKPTRLKAGLEDKIIAAVREQLGDLFKAPFDPKKLQGTRPLSPQQSGALIRTANKDFVVELVAAEPLVQSPVAIAFGPDGRLWVAEMFDYPTGTDGTFRPGGRVKVLEDTDGDGKYDKATIFLDNIPFPTGITVWRKGVLVCAAPDILYAEDTKGTGKADVVKKLYSGFGTDNYQGRVNSPEYGLDGWVYGSCGLFGGRITSHKTGKALDLGDRDFRIKPDTGEIEPATGRTQQGRVRNDWGDWFGCDNSNLVWHYPLADHYLRRNPHVVPPPPAVYVPAYSDSTLLYPIRPAVQMFKLSGPPRRVTSACGLGVYRDDLLGQDYTGNTFTCEPVNLLVHREVLTPKGSTFAGHRAPEEKEAEFLASADGWFRPVQARTGPDGALWVVDMYRFVIEHPRWIPPEELAQVDVRAGATMGRIYRVLPKDAKRQASPRLDKLDTAGLVAALDSPNGTQRDLAQQMLVWRGDKSALRLLEKMVTECKRPEARLHALCTLDALNGLREDLLLAALTDKHPGVRRHAVRLSEPSAAKSSPVVEALSLLFRDPDIQVRIQLAQTLAVSDDRRAGTVLSWLAQRTRKDPYELAAVLSSIHQKNLWAVSAATLAASDEAAREELLGQLLPLSASMGDAETLPGLLSAVTEGREGQFAAWQFTALARMLDALERNRVPLDRALDPSLRKRVDLVFAQAAHVLADAQAAEARRVAATQLLGRQAESRWAEVEALGKQLVARNSAELQSAVVVSLARIDDEQVPRTLLAGWKSHSPALRGQILDVLLSRDAWLGQLLAAVEKGDIQPADLDAARRQRLLQHKDAAVRRRAAKLLAAAVNSDRKKILDDYQAVLSMAGDKARGKAVFAQRCATCHLLDGVGHAVGPDLAQMQNKAPAAFLIAILDPNQAVDPRYVQYLAVTKAGRQHSGILAGETATSITLREQDGKETVLLRNELEVLESTGKSLMPEGLEKDLTKQDLADLIAYLGEKAPPAKQVAGNTPAVVKPEKDGTLRLSATTCEIRGGEITFEPEFNNIGMWHGADDHVVWAVQVDRPGRYDVYLDWACDDGSAGNVLVLDAGGASLKHKVAGTGGWDKYRMVKIGTIALSAGVQRLTVRPEAKPQGALLDLRGILLVKEGAEPPDEAKKPEPKYMVEIARAILDESRPAAERDRLCRENGKHAAGLIREMTRDLSSDKEEYRRIPWVWRVAITAGKENDAAQLQSILDAAMPSSDEPLRHWQAVVLGGGIINGLTQINVWPDRRLAELIDSLPGRPAVQKERWRRALTLAAAMADDAKVPNGTRYDALRMTGLEPWSASGERLTRYLAKGTNDELQLGAISALGDMRQDSPKAAKALLENLGNFSKSNRELALDALVRDEKRIAVLLDAVETGQLRAAELGPQRVAKIKAVKDDTLRQRAERLLK